MRRLLLPTLLLSGCGLLGGASGSCDSAKLDDGAAAIAQAPAALKTTLAIALVGEACGLEALRKPDFASPDAGALAVVQFVRADPTIWDRACTQGSDVFASVAKTAPDQQVALLHKACGLDRYGWTTADGVRLGDQLLPAIIAAGTVNAESEPRRSAVLAALAGR